MSDAAFIKTTDFNPPSDLQPLRKSPYVATAAEAVENYRENPAGIWYTDRADPEDAAGKYAFQRLRHTWFTPNVVPKFKLSRDDKFYAIGSCFARGIESSLTRQKITVESAAPEFARLQPANNELSGLGFTNKYNTYSILNELRWALDPSAVFPQESIVEVTKTTWYDPHTNPSLSLVDLNETLERRATMQAVTRRIQHCRAVIITLGLAEVWRDVKADVFINRTPIPSLIKTQPGRYEFHLTSFRRKLGKSGSHICLVNPVRTSRRTHRGYSLTSASGRVTLRSVNHVVSSIGVDRAF